MTAGAAPFRLAAINHEKTLRRPDVMKKTPAEYFTPKLSGVMPNNQVSDIGALKVGWKFCILALGLQTIR